MEMMDSKSAGSASGARAAGSARGGSSSEVAARVTLAALGLSLVGGAAYYLGYQAAPALTIVGVAGVLALAAVELPWGGLVLPSDALILTIALVTPGFGVAVLGFGAALAGAGWAAGLRRPVLVGPIRTVAATIATVVVWQRLMPAEVLRSGIEGGWVADYYRRWLLSGEAAASMAVACAVFFGVGLAADIVLRSQRALGIRQYWRLNFGRNLHHLIFTLLVGAIAAVVYADLGAPALALFAFPLLLTRDALKRGLELRTSRLEALRALSSSVDARDRYTFDHSSRVSRLAALLTREMGFAESTVEAVESGALLHDIGKLGVDLEILSKPGPLEGDEMAAIRMHPLRSARVVSQVELFKGAIDIVRHHHERPDGAGYPYGLKAHEIPIGARILNVADAFDAMTSDRPYRKKRDLADAVEELRRGSGTEFDPVVVEYLMKILKKRPGDLADLGAA
jgi:putative nucleotidyltransferase with HDIG domain